MQVVFSVITVSYNSSSFIVDTINSVLNQTYKNFEYIILDDNSTDSTWQIIESFKDERIIAYRNPNNLGEYQNRNKGIEIASGKYIIFIDGDDYMYWNALETFFFYTQQFPGCAMIFTREWDPGILYPLEANSKMLYQFEFLDRRLMGGNFTKVLFKRNALVEAGYLPSNINTGDTYIQLKIALTHSGVAINDGLTWWRQRKENATAKFFKNNRHHAETMNYRLAFLDDPLCPLSIEEKHLAKTNMFGLYLRDLIRMIINSEWDDFVYLIRKVKIPLKYYRSFFIKSKMNYFNKYDGDNPLHTTIEHQPLIKNITV